MKTTLSILVASIGLFSITTFGQEKVDVADLPSQHSTLKSVNQSINVARDLPSQHSISISVMDLPSQHTTS